VQLGEPTEQSPDPGCDSLCTEQHSKRLSKDEQEDHANASSHATEIGLSRAESFLSPAAQEEPNKGSRETDVLEGGLVVGGDGFDTLVIGNPEAFKEGG
jgi:hypothetical protein